MSSNWLIPTATSNDLPQSTSQPSLLNDGKPQRSLDDYFLTDEGTVIDREAFASSYRIPTDHGTTVIHAHSGYGSSLLCLSDGRIAIAEKESEPRLLTIYSEPATCEHGIQDFATKQIRPISACCSSSEVVVATESDGLWTFPKLQQTQQNSVVLRVSPDTVHAKQMCAEQCLNVQAGSDFFIAMVDVSSRPIDESIDNEGEKREEQHRSHCSVCDEDRRLRLSTLMREADREAEAAVRLRKSRPTSSAIDERQAALMWNGMERDQADARAPSMLTFSEQQLQLQQRGGAVGAVGQQRVTIVETDRMSMRAMRGDSPTIEASAAAAAAGTSGLRIVAKIAVLTWGANAYGQLGHGDNVQRSQPQPIAFFDAGRRAVAVAAGDRHAAAVTAFGTAYVWGANVWSGDDKRAVLTPTIFKTGKSACVLDMSAAGQALAMLVEETGGAVSILVARDGGVSRIAGAGMGRAVMSANGEMVDTTTRLRLLSDGRIVTMRSRGRRERRRAAAAAVITSAADPSSCSSLLQEAWHDAVRLGRLFANLEELGKYCLQERMKQNSDVSLNEAAMQSASKKTTPSPSLGQGAEDVRFIRRLNKALQRIVGMCAVHADRVRDVLREVIERREEEGEGEDDTVSRMSAAYEVLNSTRFRAVFTRFVNSYAVARAYGALEALPFVSESADHFLDMMSLTYEVTSTRSDSLVRKLFSLPLSFLSQANDKFAELTRESVSGGAPSGFSTEWKLQLREAVDIFRGAIQTAYWWRKAVYGELAHSLHTPGRFLVWGSGEEFETNLLSITAQSAGYLSSKYTHLLVFNDIVVFATKHSDQRFPAQLVWLSDKEKETDLLVTTPDEKFDLIFVNAEEKEDFKRGASFWHWSNYVVETKNAREPSVSLASSQVVVHSTPPATRSSRQFVFKNSEAYEGQWRNGLPHGIGRKTTSTYTYEGSFEDGLQHGFGVLSVQVDTATCSGSTGSHATPTPAAAAAVALFYVPATESGQDHLKRHQQHCTVIRGQFERGKATGLCRIEYADGVVYRGYVEAGVAHGFGELLEKERHHIGFFSRGRPHGYGVSSALNTLGTIRRKHLGYFDEGVAQGEGVLIDGCGAYCEGEFRAGQLRTGRLQCPTADDSSSSGSAHTIEYRGEFNGWRHALGKGTLDVSPTMSITGRFNYAILGDDGSIKKTDEADIVDAKIEMRRASERIKEVFHGEPPFIEDHLDAEEEWCWRPLVDLFLKEELGQAVEKTEVREAREGEIEMSSMIEITGEQEKRAEEVREGWRRVERSERRRREGGGGEDVSLFHLCSAAIHRRWSSGYYVMVEEEWRRASEKDSEHPLSRLSHTCIQIYQASYGGTLGAHRCVQQRAASELRLILYSVYAVVRSLFPSLPYNPLDPIPDEDEDGDMGSQETLCTLAALRRSMSAGPEEGELEEKREEEGGRYAQTATASVRSRSPPSGHSMMRAPPAISFVFDHFFARLHPILLPMYIEAAAEFDDVYWSKIVYLNAHTDVKLLSFLDVPRCIWPIDLENPEDLGAAVICNTARHRFYKSAIKMLQNIPTQPNPLDKLRILAETFVEMNSCVEAHAESKQPVWEADSLMPAFIYVVVRASIKHLGAEIRFIDDFSSRLHEGPIGPMFTYLKSAFVYICTQSDVA